MNPYTLYDDSGQIIGTGYAPDEIPAGAIAGHWSGISHHVVDGVAVSKPDKPSPHHRFDYGAGEWVFDIDAAWAAVRVERNRRIAETDWTVLPDVRMSDESRAQWAAYRQALRDVTEQSDPLAIVWPVPPQ